MRTLPNRGASRRARPACVVALALLTLLPIASAAAQVVHVDHRASGAGTGVTWSDAYPDLQAALGATSTGEIWVASGTYYPGPPGNQSATFQLKSGVALYGGFAGHETSRSQRNVAANPCILSGDINQDDTYGTGTQWWRFSWNNNAGNSLHIVTGSGVDATATLDGFTLLAGASANGNSVVGGGGLYVIAGSPTIRSCTFRYNAFGFGSAIHVRDCDSVFEGCVIRDGYTFGGPIGACCSGIYAIGICALTFTDCEFVNHYSVATMGRGQGAAVHLDWDCRATFTRCSFTGNQTGNWFAQGDPDGAYGGGIYNLGDGLSVVSCSFVDNFAHAGAGIYSWGTTTVVNSLFARNRAVEYPVTPVVSRGNFGAGFATVARAGRSTVLVNCSFIDNECDKGGGIAANSQDAVTVRSCVVFHNRARPRLPGQDPIWIVKQQIVGSYDLGNCCVEGLMQTEPGEDPPDPSKYPGCFDVDPGLVDWQGGDYHLGATSPCIDTGDTSAVPAGLVEDLDGNARLVRIVDIGCYEFGGVPLPSLVATNLVQTWPARYTVHNARPGETVFFLYSFAGTGAGPCLPPPSGLCIELLAPFDVFTTVTADNDGKARLGFTVPAGVPLVDFHLQGLIIRGSLWAQSVATNTVSATINKKP